MKDATFVVKRRFRDHLGDVMPGTIPDRERLQQWTNLETLLALNMVAIADEADLSVASSEDRTQKRGRKSP